MQVWIAFLLMGAATGRRRFMGGLKRGGGGICLNFIKAKGSEMFWNV